MLEKLQHIKEKYLQLEAELKSDAAIQDPKVFAKLNKEFHQVAKIYNLIAEHENSQQEIKNLKSVINSESEEEIIELAREEIASYKKTIVEIEKQIKIQLLPQDPNDDKNIILEMRAGAGGDEAGLFVQELFEAYQHYSQKKNWKMEVISISSGNSGGYKEVIANITGSKVYSILKYESGVHRVQRVPKTESQGRVHTSTITVVVLPEADAVNVNINPSDLRIDVCRASGAGGQHVNTTDSAVRIVHLPTKLMVYCQEGKSQHANKDKALKILYARLLDLQTEQIKTEESKRRKQQMGVGDRSERIRTYNFPQSRLTDHRIQFTSKNLPIIMTGEFEDIFSSLTAYYQSLALKGES